MKNERGYVYLFRKGKYYKIGASSNPEKRVKQFKKTPPFDTELICTVYIDDMFGEEKGLHKGYKDKRINKTEWFLLSQKDVDDIKWVFEVCDILDGDR